MPDNSRKLLACLDGLIVACLLVPGLPLQAADK